MASTKAGERQTRARLEKQRREINQALSAFETADRVARNRKLTGKCFRFSNSYGSSGPRWWLYTRIIGVDEHGYLSAFHFESREGDDSDIRIRTEDTMICLLSGAEEISLATFRKHWTALQARIAAESP